MEQISDIKYVTGSDVICIEGNGCRKSHGGNGWHIGGGMYTLNTVEVHCVAYRISAYESNAMKSKNPHSGIGLAEISRTLDSVSCGSPNCNQGGVVIVELRVGSDRTPSE